MADAAKEVDGGGSGGGGGGTEDAFKAAGDAPEDFELKPRTKGSRFALRILMLTN